MIAEGVKRPPELEHQMHAHWSVGGLGQSCEPQGDQGVKATTCSRRTQLDRDNWTLLRMCQSGACATPHMAVLMEPVSFVVG